MQRGSTGAITNNSTETRSMSLAGTSYTVTVGISSDSSMAATVASISNTVAGKIAVKGYSTTYTATISSGITNSVSTGEVSIYANSSVNSTTQGITNAGVLFVYGGTISGNNKGIYNTGTATISGGTITAAENAGTGILTVSGGTISGASYGISNSSTGTVTITGGTISSTNSSATSGAIKTSAGTIIIGTNDATVSTSSPAITSAGGFGIYETNSAARVEVYDGIIKGKYSSDLTTTTACKGYVGVDGDPDVGCNEIVEAVRTGYGFTVEYDATNVVTSQYLVQAGALVERPDPDTVETTISNALTKIDNYYGDSGTIKVLSNLTECVSISNKLTITLKLNGKTVTCSTANTYTISNSGVLTITGSTGTITSTNYRAVNNTGTITVSSGTISAAGNGINNTRTLTVNGGHILSVKHAGSG